jgi:hypothetical protein
VGNNINYAALFEDELKLKYKRELLTGDLTTEGVKFVSGKTVRMPVLTLAGFRDHSRDGGFNRRSVANDFIVKTLEHDRDVEFFVDAMDVDESNFALSAANITNAFDSEFAIPETDAYRFSKLYKEYTDLGGSVYDSTFDEGDSPLTRFDNFMAEMDEAEVPEDGRILYLTPEAMRCFKKEAGPNRLFETADINRCVKMIDGVKVVVVPAGRMKTEYVFTDGFEPEAGALTMHMVLVHPKSVVAVCKHGYIKLWEPGTHTQGDGYLYQNRQYGDLFVIPSRAGGIKICAF